MMKLLGSPLSTSQNCGRILGSEIGYVHGSHYPKPHSGLSKASLPHTTL